MATITKHLKARTELLGQVYTVSEAVIDFSLDGNSTGAGDIVEAIAIPEGAVVTEAYLEILIASTATVPTLDVGDTANPDGYVDGADNATLGLVKGAGAYIATGKRYAADDVISVVTVVAETDGKIRLSVTWFLAELS